MAGRAGEQRLANRWWTLILLATVGVLGFVTTTAFLGTFRSSVPVTVTSDRSGLVLETGAKVKLRGVDVGHVAAIGHADRAARLTLEIDTDQIRHIPANVEPRINVTTIFGAKFVDLVYPRFPSAQRLAAGAVLRSTNVTTEVNTVFENIVDLLRMVDAVDGIDRVRYTSPHPKDMREDVSKPNDGVSQLGDQVVGHQAANPPRFQVINSRAAMAPPSRMNVCTTSVITTARRPPIVE